MRRGHGASPVSRFCGDLSALQFPIEVMTTHGWITLFACAGNLALALLVLLRGTRGRLALPLVLFSVLLFFWDFAALPYEISALLWCHWLDLVPPPLSPLL